ncbi:MAG: tetratricopeptide repeat protein [Agriterribacter sp.]
MKQLSFLLLFTILAITGTAQQNADTLQQTGRNYMRKGDWGNAIMVFNRALQLKPGDADIQNDIAYTYFLQRDFTKALQVIKPVIESDNADVRSFQIAGTTYRAIEELKEGAKVYEKGLKKFPFSGVLYSEYGELLWQKKDYNAINQWETGIKVDPNHAGNYYNAARYYYLTTDKIWSLLYGEIFVNMESYTIRTAEIKSLLYDGYKKLFADADLLKSYKPKNKNDFEIAFLTSMNAQSPKAATGINPEKLIEIRRGFIQNWFEANAQKFPYRLFEYQQQLIKLNMFEAYNQWLFGAAISADQYQVWIQQHKAEYDAFSNFQRGRIFKLPKDQYYQRK